MLPRQASGDFRPAGISACKCVWTLALLARVRFILCKLCIKGPRRIVAFDDPSYLASNASRYPDTKSAIFLPGNIPDPLTISEQLAAHRWCFIRISTESLLKLPIHNLSKCIFQSSIFLGIAEESAKDFAAFFVRIHSRFVI